MQDWKIGNMLVVLAVVVGLIGVVAVLHGVLPEEPSRYKDLVGIIQSGAIAAALIIGGIIANAKLELFRHLEPHLTIAHTINHRPIGESYVHIDVTATLHNNSKVKVELREGLFRLQEIAPVLDDQELEERLAARNFISDDAAFVQWPTIGEFSCNWGNYNLIVEPGQVYRETVEFVVPKEIGTVAIHSLFQRAAPRRETPQSWGMTTVYDMMIQASGKAG